MFAGFQQIDLFAGNACVDLCAIELPDIKVSGASSPEYETFCVSVTYFVEKLESFDLILSLIEFSDSAFTDILLMDLSIMTANFLLKIVKFERAG